MNIKISITITCILLSGFITYGQISHGGQPWSIGIKGLKSATVYNLPEFDYASMMKEDLQAGRAKPFRYGKVHELSLTPNNSGTWQTLPDGRKIWQLAIKSLNAYSLSIVCDQFNLKDQVQLYIYTPGMRSIIGSFNSRNNNKDGYFSTIPLAGDEIIIELDVESNVDYGVFHISGIVHDYKNILKTGYGSSGSCNVNINCPEGNDWQDEKRAIAKVLFSGQLCSGALVNNTGQDAKPYFLTAEHCISTSLGASIAVFWFNYESPGCISTVDPPHQSINGSTLKATGGNLDFTLLELSSVPPSEFNVFYAGWNTGSALADSSFCIHHPQGDIKKISKDLNQFAIGDYGSGYVANSHWNILEWDLGTTEGGSSGSPLFDQNHHIVGDLTGGDASCSYNFNDYFARFDMSWDYHTDSSMQLKYWLDPLQFGVATLDGFDPGSVTLGLDAKINQILGPVNSFCTYDSITPKIVIFNNGSVDINSLKVNYRLGNGEVVTEQWNGVLTPSQSTIYSFNKTRFPSGEMNLRFFVSEPNESTDLKTFNDTLSKNVEVQHPLEYVEILGDNIFCSQSGISEFSSGDFEAYTWQVTGGDIIGNDDQKSVKVEWNKWGNRSIELTVNNLCNAISTEILEIISVELVTEIKISTGSNADEICWNIKDCDGNDIFMECNLSDNSSYIKRLALPPGCYTFTINTGNAIADFLVSDACNEFNIFSASSFSGDYSETFYIEESNNPVEFNLYPNPVENELNIEAAFDELYDDASFSITNMAGMIVVPEQKLEGNTTIQVGNLRRGMYIIEINTSRGRFAGKIVVLR